MSKYGSFKIKGLNELQKAITEKYSGAKTTRIINSAVYEGTEYFANELQKNVGAFKDKGYEQVEVVATKSRKRKGSYQAKVGWNGEHNRYAIVHLNEFGYTRAGKQYIPRGFGVIKKTIEQSESEYFNRVGKKMEELL